MKLAILLVVDEPTCTALAAELLPEGSLTVLPAADFMPPAPFKGRLFALLEEAAARYAGTGERTHSARGVPALGLVTPVVWYTSLGLDRGGGQAEATTAPPAHPLPRALLVSDHVNLVPWGPLAGRWPAGRARSFPSVTGLYHRPNGEPFASDARWGTESAAALSTAASRLSSGGPIYSLAVAGVGDADRLTPFERRQMWWCGLRAASATLVPPAIVAAYYGFAVVAIGAPRLAKPVERK
jgi:hypothetical protein